MSFIEVLQTIIHLLTSLAYNIAIVAFFSYLSKPRFHKYTVIIPAVFFYFLTLIIESTIYIYELNLSLNILFLISIALMFHNFKRNLFYIAAVEVLFLIADEATYYTISIILQIQQSAYELTPGMMMAGQLSTMAIGIALLSIYAHNIKVVERSDVPAGYWIIYLLIPISSAFLLYYINRQSSTYNSLSLATVIVVLLINILTIISYQRALDLLRIKTENEKLKEQTQQQAITLATQTELEHARHNLKNQLLPIQAALLQKDNQSALQQIEIILGGIIPKTIRTGIEPIDYMLSYKEKLCCEKDIKVNIELDFQNYVEINYYDLSVILGIAFDNAIESCEQCSIDRKIDILIVCKQNAFIITLCNPYTHELVRDHKGMLRTTKTDKRHHGFGIKSMMRLAEKNNGILLTEADNQIFSLKIIFYGSPIKENILITQN